MLTIEETRAIKSFQLIFYRRAIRDESLIFTLAENVPDRGRVSYLFLEESQTQQSSLDTLKVQSLTAEEGRRRRRRPIPTDAVFNTNALMCRAAVTILHI